MATSQPALFRTTFYQIRHTPGKTGDVIAKSYFIGVRSYSALETEDL
jgi:hypothetical protein